MPVIAGPTASALPGLAPQKVSPLPEPGLPDLSPVTGAKGDPDTDPKVWPKPTPKPGTAIADSKGEGFVSAGAASSSASPDSASASDTGTVYDWYDGDRVMSVELQPDLEAQSSNSEVPGDEIIARVGDYNIVTKTDKTVSKANPVFRSKEDASLMTLPGGVLLALDSTWDQERIDAFFQENGIDAHSVSPMEYLKNAYFIETEPGLPSLDLANKLAVMDGVEVSSPNWWQERGKR